MKETKSLGWKYFLKHADMVSQCDFLRSWPTFASRDRLQPVCSRCRRRARCCLKDQKSQNLGILKEISKEIFAMSLSPWDPSPNRNAPAPSKSLQSSSRPAFRKHTVHKICQDMCNNDNVTQRTTTWRQRPTRYFLGATGWEECSLEDYGGGGCCSCRHLEAMKSHEKHSSQRKQIQVSRFFSHKHNWFQWNVGLFKFSDPNQRLIWCQWTVAFTRLHESEQVESFDLLFAMLWPEWSDFPSSLMRPCDPWCSVPPKGPHQPNHCPRRTSTSCTPAINIHIIHMHIQKSSKNSQANQQQSQYRRTYTCLYAYILQYMLCQTVKLISMWCQTSKESH